MSPPPFEPKFTTLSLALWALGCGAQTQDQVDRSTHDDQTTEPSASSEGEQDPSPSNDSNPALDPTPGVSPQPNQAIEMPGVPPVLSRDPKPEEELFLPDDDLIPDDEVPFCDAYVGRDATARELMAPFVVRHDDFARRVIYSWTTQEQVEELRANPTLLTRSMTEDSDRGRAANVMASVAEQDELAALLSRPEYEKRRFGWSNPWATLLGWESENYGDQLLRITLKPEAWIGRLRVYSDGSLEWTFADVNGNPVTPEQVLNEPDRLAAMYFVDERDAGCGTIELLGAAFREYFVHNEAMIESWAIASQDVRDEIERSLTALRALHTVVKDAECTGLGWCWSDLMRTNWNDALDDAESAALHYLGSLAFPNSAYDLTSENLETLIERLESLPLADPLSYTYDN